VATYDLSPLFRSTIGFDRLARLMDAAVQGADTPSYPPYNIEKLAEDGYRLTLAVAGFGEDDLEITVKENALLVVGRPRKEPEQRHVLHRGIAGRAFERRFELADHMVVHGAALENGLLHINLKRVIPETLKPRRIEIRAGAPEGNLRAIEAKAA